MDLVYIIKKSEYNEDLRYSLRSIAKFIPDNKVWIVGYKPSWVTNVEYLPVEQKEDKWKNSINNINAACNCDKISEDFVLMNDDFFAIRPINNLKESANLYLGTLEEAIDKYKKYKGKSHWMDAFSQVNNLLKSLNIEGPYYNYESHTPLIINKQKYLEVMNLPKVQDFMKTSKVLHKRTLYKNIDKSLNQRLLKSDVKLNQNNDDTLKKIKNSDWLSVFDNQVCNTYFKDLNKFLIDFFPNQCKYEIPQENYKIKTYFRNPNEVCKKPKNFYTF